MQAAASIDYVRNSAISLERTYNDGRTSVSIFDVPRPRDIRRALRDVPRLAESLHESGLDEQEANEKIARVLRSFLALPPRSDILKQIINLRKQMHEEHPDIFTGRGSAPVAKILASPKIMQSIREEVSPTPFDDLDTVFGIKVHECEHLPPNVAIAFTTREITGFAHQVLNVDPITSGPKMIEADGMLELVDASGTVKMQLPQTIGVDFANLDEQPAVIDDVLPEPPPRPSIGDKLRDILGEDL